MPDDHFIFSSVWLLSPIWTTDPGMLHYILSVRVVWIIDYENVCGTNYSKNELKYSVICDLSRISQKKNYFVS